MTIAVKRYYSGMNADAPTISGQAGTLITLLDAILKDGFHSKTVTLAQTAGTATLTCNGHGFNPYDIIAISGANESAWNDEFRVLTTTANTLTFAIGAGTTSPATGTITAKIAPLGWTKPFSGTNKAAYLTKSSYIQCYTRIQDDSSTPTSAAGRWAKMRGYETMSDVDTGTGPFPTVAQSTNGLSIVKSGTSDATTHNWWAVGDGGILYLGIFWLAGSPTLADTFVFGDANSIRQGDAYSYIVSGTASDTLPGAVGTNNSFAALNTVNSTQSGMYLARSYTQVGSSVVFGKMGNNSISSTIGSGGLTFPHQPNNGLLFSPISINEVGVIRCRNIPGMYQPLHLTPLNYLDMIVNPPDLSGRVLQAFDLTSSGSRGQSLIDIIGPWR